MTFHRLFNNSIIPLNTYDATAARSREDAADAIGAMGRMEDVMVDGADVVGVATVAKYHEDVADATAAKSRAETVADDVADDVVLLVPLLPSTVRMLLVPLRPGLTKMHEIHLRFK